MGVTIQLVGLSGLMVNMTIPVYGSECVDVYSTTIDGLRTPLRHNESVTDPSQSRYSFYFEVNICQELGDITVSVVSNTNGIHGATYTLTSEVLHAVDRSSKGTKSNHVSTMTC